jgi:hypothetical protein
MALGKAALGGALAGGLLAPEDAEALVLHKGLTGATDFAKHVAGDRKAPRIGRDPRGNQIAEGKMAQQIGELKKNMRMLKGRPDKQSRLVMEFVHNNTDYGRSDQKGSWLSTAGKIDGGVNGPLYLTGVDILAEDLVKSLGKEFQPAIEHYARRRIGNGGRKAEYGGEAGAFIAKSNDLSGSFDPLDKAVYDAKAGKLPQTRGDFVDPKTGRKKAGRASLGVGTPSHGDDMLQAQHHNHEAAVDQNMRDLGVSAKDPMYEYGSLLPIRSNIVTGDREMAMPDFGRDILRGLLSLGNAPKTGVYDPQSILDVVL